MADRTTHEADESLDSEAESEDTEQDDDTTPADTDDESDEPKKADAAEVKERQKAAWLSKIKEGKKTLDDMPENLNWLKREIKKELEPKKEATGLKSEIRQALQEERAEEEFDLLVEDLQESDISAEQEAELKEEYGNLLSDFPDPTAQQKLKALTIARRLVGLKSTSATVKERRHKGMTLPPLGGRKRSTVDKDKMTEMEKRLSGGLPPGYSA